MIRSPGFTKCLVWLLTASALTGCVRQPALQTADEAERLESAGLLPEAASGSPLLRSLAGAPAAEATLRADGETYVLGAMYDSAGGLRCRKVLIGPAATAGRVACEGASAWQWAAPVVEDGTR